MPGPGPQPGPGDPPAGNGDGNLKLKIEGFYTAAFDSEKKEVYTIDARQLDPRTVKGSLRRYSYPDFKTLNRFKLPQLGVRATLDAKAGLLYVATVTNPIAAQLDQRDNASASGDIAIYDLKPIRDGKTADGKVLDDGSELKPVLISVKQMIHAIELSADGKMLYVLITGSALPKKSYVVVIDTELRKETSRKVLPELAKDMAKASDGKNLLIIEEFAKTKTASVLTFDTAAMAAINPVSFSGAVVDVAPLIGGGAMVSVLPPAPPAGGVGGPPMQPGGPGAPVHQFNFKMFLLKGSTEMDLGVGNRSANNGYLEYDPDNKRLFVSSYRGQGLDVYEVADATAANGLKLKSSIRTAKGEFVGGHFFSVPDGKTLMFHNGVVIDTNNVIGSGGGVIPPGGGGVIPPGGGGVIPPGGGGVIPPGGGVVPPGGGGVVPGGVNPGMGGVIPPPPPPKKGKPTNPAPVGPGGAATTPSRPDAT